MIVRKTTLLVFMLIAFFVNNVDAVVSHYNEDSEIQTKITHHLEVNDTPKEKVSFWKILKDVRKLKKIVKKDNKDLKRRPKNGKLLVAWGLLLMVIPLVVMLIYRTATFSGWILPLIGIVGVIMLILGLIRWARYRRRQ